MTVEEFFYELKETAKTAKFRFEAFGMIRDEDACCPIIAMLKRRDDTVSSLCRLIPFTYVQNIKAVDLAIVYFHLDPEDAYQMVLAADDHNARYRKELMEACGLEEIKNDN